MSKIDPFGNIIFITGNIHNTIKIPLDIIKIKQILINNWTNKLRNLKVFYMTGVAFNYKYTLKSNNKYIFIII